MRASLRAALHDKGVLHKQIWASKQNNVLRLQIGVSSSELAQNDKRSARNLTVIARMPEDPFETLKS
eukprot:5617542-Heterocapsa_arctica.AAC.1